MNAKRFTYNYSSIQIHAQQTNCNYLAQNKIKKRKKKKTKKTEIVRKYFPLTPSPTPTHTREREREREREKEMAEEFKHKRNKKNHKYRCYL